MLYKSPSIPRCSSGSARYGDARYIYIMKVYDRFARRFINPRLLQRMFHQENGAREKERRRARTVVPIYMLHAAWAEAKKTKVAPHFLIRGDSIYGRKTLFLRKKGKTDASAVLGERERGLEIVCRYQIISMTLRNMCIIVRTRWSGSLRIERRCQSWMSALNIHGTPYRTFLGVQRERGVKKMPRIRAEPVSKLQQQRQHQPRAVHTLNEPHNESDSVECASDARKTRAEVLRQVSNFERSFFGKHDNKRVDIYYNKSVKRSTKSSCRWI
ncbi:unnamed protein product [Trichogramma brassicae]|uniref:Uncharacterized protein n=1 Tax=Trichogramma brassicae TaxID=86971 RepID=A0A6H5ISA5_9HYME|nr:unnamed protein product [Trichogramma brassicae]